VIKNLYFYGISLAVRTVLLLIMYCIIIIITFASVHERQKQVGDEFCSYRYSDWLWKL